MGPGRGFQRAVRLGWVRPGLRTERRGQDDTPMRKMVRARLPSVANRLIQFECCAGTTVQFRGAVALTVEDWSHLALRKPATSRPVDGRYVGHRFSSAMHGRRIFRRYTPPPAYRHRPQCSSRKAPSAPAGAAPQVTSHCASDGLRTCHPPVD